MDNVKDSSLACLDSIAVFEPWANDDQKAKVESARRALQDLVAMYRQIEKENEGTFYVHFDVLRVTHRGKRCWQLTYRDGAKKVTKVAHPSLNQGQASNWLMDLLANDEAWQKRNKVRETGESLVCTPPPK